MPSKPRSLLHALQIVTDARGQVATGDVEGAILNLAAAIEWILRGFDGFGMLQNDTGVSDVDKRSR